MTTKTTARRSRARKTVEKTLESIGDASARLTEELEANAAAETATSAAEVAVVDHSSQMSSWTPAANDAVTIEDVTAELLAEGIINDADELLPIDGVERIELNVELLPGEVHAEPAAVQDGPAEELLDTTDDNAPESFDQVIASFSEDTVKGRALAIGVVLDERAAFERSKAPDNENIQRTLKNSRKTMITLRAASVTLACNVDPAILNRSLHEGSRYNVYAIGKLADAIFALSGGQVSNAINNAVMRSLFRFRAAGKTFTGEMAKAAASDKIRVDAAVREHLVRHTVSASTAPTQASSTMQALETLGIVKRTGGTKNPTYELTDSPVVRKLEEVLAKAA